MDSYARNTVLRMLPYGVHVLTTQSQEDAAVGAVVSWVTQASFSPPLLVTALRVGSTLHQEVKAARTFALNILGKQQASVARTFFHTVREKGGQLAGQSFRTGTTGAPLLDCAAGYVECEVDLSLEKGDHSIFVSQVVDAGLKGQVKGRPDDVSLVMRDLGGDVFYGG